MMTEVVETLNKGGITSHQTFRVGSPLFEFAACFAIPF